VISAIPFTDINGSYAAAPPRISVSAAAGVRSRDVSKAHRLAKGLRAESVWVNCYQASGPAADRAIRRLLDGRGRSMRRAVFI
jgi:aldehyde dehydrogenase (NAD+)